MVEKYRAAKPPKPCNGRASQNNQLINTLGVCMFQYECLQLNGEPIGLCFNSYLVGTCCRLPDKLRIPLLGQQEQSTSANITSISTPPSFDVSIFSTSDKQKKNDTIVTSHFVPNNNGSLDLEDDGQKNGISITLSSIKPQTSTSTTIINTSTTELPKTTKDTTTATAKATTTTTTTTTTTPLPTTVVLKSTTTTTTTIVPPTTSSSPTPTTTPEVHTTITEPIIEMSNAHSSLGLTTSTSTSSPSTSSQLTSSAQPTSPSPTTISQQSSRPDTTTMVTTVTIPSLSSQASKTFLLTTLSPPTTMIVSNSTNEFDVQKSSSFPIVASFELLKCIFKIN